MHKFTFPLASPDPVVIKCRHCGSTEVRPSHKSSGSGPNPVYRCQACKRHFRVGPRHPAVKYVIAGGVMLALLLSALALIVFSDDLNDPLNQPVVDSQIHDALPQIQQKASRGDAQSQYELAWNHWQNADYQKAFPWLKTAAEQGHTEAEYLLGMAYLNGRGTVQNYRTAMELFNKSAQRGHMEAQYRLGILHRDGLAGPTDKESAYLWLNIAAAHGHEDALLFRDKLATAMGTESITRAQEASTQAMNRINDVKPAPKTTPIAAKP